MPGPGDELRAGLQDGVSEALAQSLNFDQLAAKMGRRRAERGEIQSTIGERFGGEPSINAKHPRRELSPLFRLDIDAFHGQLLTQLTGRCNGFAYRLLAPGGPGLAVQSGKARNSADGDVAWTTDVRMHVASVSKLITAMAASKALADAGVTGKTAIYPWLPLYWRPFGPNVEGVTFDMLMTHESGLWSATTDEVDFGEIKSQIYRGALPGVPLGLDKYQNVNFSLFRILIPVLTGAIKQSLVAPGGKPEDTDRLWDALTIQAYGDYVRDNVFAPAQVVDARTASDAGYAMAYRWPMVGAGWDSGDLSPLSATVAWHLSANELVRILQAFVDGRVVSRKRMHRLLDAGWGVDQSDMTRAGPFFLKSGNWESGGNQMVQAVAGLLPGDLPFAVLVNSQVVDGAPNPKPVWLTGLVMDAVKAHIVSTG